MVPTTITSALSIRLTSSEVRTNEATQQQHDKENNGADTILGRSQQIPLHAGRSHAAAHMSVAMPPLGASGRQQGQPQAAVCKRLPPVAAPAVAVQLVGAGISRKPLMSMDVNVQAAGAALQPGHVVRKETAPLQGADMPAHEIAAGWAKGLETADLHANLQQQYQSINITPSCVGYAAAAADARAAALQRLHAEHAVTRAVQLQMARQPSLAHSEVLSDKAAPAVHSNDHSFQPLSFARPALHLPKQGLSTSRVNSSSSSRPWMRTRDGVPGRSAEQRARLVTTASGTGVFHRPGAVQQMSQPAAAAILQQQPRSIMIGSAESARRKSDPSTATAQPLLQQVVTTAAGVRSLTAASQSVRTQLPPDASSCAASVRTSAHPRPATHVGSGAATSSSVSAALGGYLSGLQHVHAARLRHRANTVRTLLACRVNAQTCHNSNVPASTDQDLLADSSWGAWEAAVTSLLSSKPCSADVPEHTTGAKSNCIISCTVNQKPTTAAPVSTSVAKPGSCNGSSSSSSSRSASGSSCGYVTASPGCWVDSGLVGRDHEHGAAPPAADCAAQQATNRSPAGELSSCASCSVDANELLHWDTQAEDDGLEVFSCEASPVLSGDTAHANTLSFLVVEASPYVGLLPGENSGCAASVCT